MNFQSLLIAFMVQTILCAPIVITRMHTAEAVTVTDTYTTVTNTHTAPTVQYLVSDGVTYTSTLTDDAAYPEPTTFTTTLQNKNPALPGDTDTEQTNEAAATTTDPATEAAPTTTDPATEAAPTTTDPATEAAPTTTSPTTAAAPTTTSPTTEATPTTTSSTTTLAPADDDSNDGSNSNDSGSGDDSNNTDSGSNNSGENTQQTSATTTTTEVSLDQNNKGKSDTRTTTHEAPTAIGTPSVITSPTTTPTTTATATSSTSSVSTAASGKLTIKPTSIVYSPYNNDNSCKDYDAVSTDLNYIKGTLGVNKIRVYGTDCSSVQNVETVAKSLGMKVNQGFWIGPDGVDSIDDGVDQVIAWGEANGWDTFDFITVGNEVIQFNYATVDELLNKISEVKSKLKAAGYTGLVTTSEPPHVIVENPEMCTNGVVDFIGIQPHSYFDPYSKAETAGSFVKGQIDLVRTACGSDIDILVTETGYPSRGIQNGGNIPSKANQLIAVQAIMDELNGEATILSTFDDYWKDAGSYGIEQSFGIWDLLA